MDNSVLFSLSQLKTLEDERIADEAAAAAARAAAAERARREAEEGARAAVENERRAADERRRREAQERERARRAEELRLIEAEARMEEEAQRRLEAARRQSEAQVAAELRAQRPVGMILTLASAALLAVGGLGVWLMRSEDDAELRSRAALAEVAAREQAATASQLEQRARLDAELAAVRQRLAATAPAPEPPRAAARPARPVRRVTRKKVAAAAPAAPLPSALDIESPLVGD